MEPHSTNGEEIVGLTLYLAGSFEPQVFLDALPLRPIRCEHAATNAVTIVHRNKAPTRFVPTRRIECDEVKLSVPGPPSVAERFEVLLAAIATLAPATRALWDSLTERTADLGLNWTNCSNCGTEYDIPGRIVKALGDAGISLRISVYAASEAIEKACREREGEQKEKPPATSD